MCCDEMNSKGVSSSVVEERMREKSQEVRTKNDIRKRKEEDKEKEKIREKEQQRGLNVLERFVC